MILETLYKANKDKIQQWQIEVVDDKYRSVEGFVGGKMTTSEWTIAKPKNVGKKNETTGTVQALAEAQAKTQKKLDKDWFYNIEDISNDRFQVQLAHKFSEQEKKITYPCIEEPKLDGMRCYTTLSGMYSRENKPIGGAPHIHVALNPFFQKFPEGIIDGELYNHELKDDFNKLISIIKKATPTEEQLQESKDVVEYHVYDILPKRGSTLTNTQRTAMRLELGNMQLPGIKIVTSTICENKDELDAQYAKHLEQGYEGQMVRNSESVYEEKRSYNLQKRKEFIDEEFRIVDILEGEGNRSGMLGKFQLMTEDGELFEANSRGSFEYFREVLANKTDYINKLATVRYQNMTPRGVPRFPVVVSIRDYE